VKSYIIHLPGIAASEKTATRLKQKLKNFGMQTELFSGTLGTDAVAKFKNEERTLHPYGLKGKLDIDSKEAKKMSTPGVMGCFDSHYRLWKQCYDTGKPLIIWEDDIILRRKFIPVEWNEILILALGHPTKSPRWMHLLDNPRGEPTALNYKSPSMPGCCGYAIKPIAAEKLLTVYEKTYRPADNAINRNIVQMQIHSYIMGIAQVAGKKSMTRANAWKKK